MERDVRTFGVCNRLGMYHVQIRVIYSIHQISNMMCKHIFCVLWKWKMKPTSSNTSVEVTSCRGASRLGTISDDAGAHENTPTFLAAWLDSADTLVFGFLICLGDTCHRWCQEGRAAKLDQTGCWQWYAMPLLMLTLITETYESIIVVDRRITHYSILFNRFWELGPLQASVKRAVSVRIALWFFGRL